MNFSLKTEYALRAVYELSTVKSDAPLKRQTIATSQNIPVHFLENILIELKKHGIVRSVRGPGGGYLLGRPASEINMWDLYRAVDYKEYEGARCFPGLNQECEHMGECNVKPFWLEFNDKVKETMMTMKLSNLGGPAR